MRQYIVDAMMGLEGRGLIMTARQASRRGGVLRVSLEGDRVHITGQAVLFMEGDIPFDL